MGWRDGEQSGPGGGSAKINMRGDARRKPVYLHANKKENKSCFVFVLFCLNVYPVFTF